MGKDSPKKDRKKHGLDSTKHDKLKQQEPGLIVVDKDQESDKQADCASTLMCDDGDVRAHSQLAVVAPAVALPAAEERIDISSALSLINSKMDMLLQMKASHDQVVSDVGSLKHEIQIMKADAISSCHKLSSLGPLEAKVHSLCDELKHVKAALATRPRLDPSPAQPSSKGKGGSSSMPTAPSADRDKSKGKGAGKAPDSQNTQNDSQYSDVDKKVLHFSGFPLPWTHEEFLDFATKSLQLPATASLKTRAM
eukprot:6487093-Amphidinium_carterae.2